MVEPPADPSSEAVPSPAEAVDRPADATPDLPVGVGPHPLPWPDGPQYDPELLRDGDRRNVTDRYRYWTVAAIVAELDTRRHEFAVAIENWQHDANIGTVVRTANAFLAREVLIVGRKRWNRRGAMVTDRYQHVRHVPSVPELLDYAATAGYRWWRSTTPPAPGRWRPRELPASRCSCSARKARDCPSRPALGAGVTLSIAQFGSTRSINAGVAAGIAMHAWIRQHAVIGGE